jgi:hypothetical protein
MNSEQVRGQSFQARGLLRELCKVEMMKLACQLPVLFPVLFALSP